jgi:aerobic carbon-monoxide dehydrogenase small subunit
VSIPDPAAPTSTAQAPGTPAGTDLEVVVTVNGVPRTATVPARRLLSDFLRHDLRLTGTHVGCEHGVCGACTVLLDGLPVRSCLAFAVSVHGREVTTVEGLAADDGTLHPVQQAFHDQHGLQCGYCTPGFVMSACGFLADEPDPDEATIREGMSGNLCRCTGYAGILAAVKQAAGALRVSGADPVARHHPSHDPPRGASPAAGDGRRGGAR